MKIKLLFLILIFSLSYITGYTQTESNTKKNKLEFSTGYIVGALKNLEFAPIARYNYNGLIYKLNYERISKNQNLFEIQLDYLNSELKTDFIPTLNAGYSKTGLGFSYLKQIYYKNAFSIHLGLQAQTNVSVYSNSNYYAAEQEFGIASRFTYQLNKKQYLTSKIIIPIALLRVTESSGFSTYSLNRYQSALWVLEYGYTFSNNFDLKLNYDFKYNRLQIPNIFRELQHQINLGINYKF
ncbi:hypothetical protein BFR04_01765 [Gaetbulibacter sp. 4G1]|nr:hypothetical protein [Gaetbulibacter sp. 4G1]PIA79596.1 hypothetical protein BFR04_01765 [Gaetbulibacter sp. 4G1]